MNSSIQLKRRVSLIPYHYPATPKASEGGPLPRRSLNEGGSLITVLLLALCCFAPCSALQAVTPAPDGPYPGGNTAEGQNALFTLTTGVWNTAIGHQTLFRDTTGNQNTATGYQALFNNTTGSLSTANGAQALYHNTTGNYNVATGFRTLYSNITGSNNTGNGYEALALNTTGGENTANGFKALYYNTTGGNNTANGDSALYSNTTGFDNTANGASALENNTVGADNTANGVDALNSNTTGFANTANGVDALIFNTTGSNDTAIGVNALAFNTAGSNNTALGSGAGFNVTTANNVICIGNSGQNVSNSCFIGQIFGVTSSGGTAVFINSDGKLGTATSSRRFKKEIRPMDQTSQAVLGLKPVTFQYKSDAKGTPQFGLIAEEVAEVDPDLVVRDKNGEIYTVRYDAVNAMLLNEFLKEHRKVEALKKDFQTTIAQQQKEIQTLTASLKEQAALIQKVSAQLDVIKPAPQMVLNSQ